MPGKRIAEQELAQRQSHRLMEYRERVLASLRYAHLPKMTAVYVIERNVNRQLVTSTERATSLYPHLDLVCS